MYSTVLGSSVELDLVRKVGGKLDLLKCKHGTRLWQETIHYIFIGIVSY